MSGPTTLERVQTAAPILDRFNEQLHREQRINTYALEMELSREWGIGYGMLKSLMIQIMKDCPRYEHLAAYYAEFSNPSMIYKLESPFYEEDARKMCVISEFKQPLARLYGARHWHHDETLAGKRKQYWEKAFQVGNRLARATGR